MRPAAEIIGFFTAGAEPMQPTAVRPNHINLRVHAATRCEREHNPIRSGRPARRTYWIGAVGDLDGPATFTWHNPDLRSSAEIRDKRDMCAIRRETGRTGAADRRHARNECFDRVGSPERNREEQTDCKQRGTTHGRSPDRLQTYAASNAEVNQGESVSIEKGPLPIGESRIPQAHARSSESQMLSRGLTSDNPQVATGA